MLVAHGKCPVQAGPEHAQFAKLGREMTGWRLKAVAPANERREDDKLARKAQDRTVFSRSGRQQADPAKSTAINVAVRVRPLNARELQADALPAWAVGDEGQVYLTRAGTSPAYAFDTVLAEASTNQDVYGSVACSVVQAAVDGINGTIFAYGVTSSGKTHTMLGGAGQPGLVQLALQQLFQRVAQLPDRRFLLSVSMMEIYNEVVNDLLEPSGTNLRLREDSSTGTTYAEGLAAVEVRLPGAQCSALSTPLQTR